VINKVLKELYYTLLVKYPNLTSTVNTICSDTDTTIHCVKLTFKHCSSHTPINITFFDFEGLYFNISIFKAISLILSLYNILDINLSYEFKIAITRSKNDIQQKSTKKYNKLFSQFTSLKSTNKFFIN
jgi:hypothetical protein